MQDQNHEILIVVIIGVLLATLLVGFIVTILFLYQRRQYRQQQELARVKEEYDQELLKSQLEIQETTLQSIAQELHDNIGQVLSVVKLSLAVLPVEKEHQAYAPLQNVREILNKAVYDLSDLTKSLHTDRIAQIGLAESIRFDLDTLKRAGLVQVSLQMQGEEYRLGEQKEIFIFRIFQELINNILKHAKASQIAVLLNYLSDEVFILSVKDNGIGFDLQEKKDSLSPLKGVGLKSIFNRAKLIGAKVKFSAEPGKGTFVLMEVPLVRHQEI